MQSDVIIESDKVTKIYSSDASNEYEKAIQLHELSKINGFCYPQPSSPGDNERIEFRKILNIKSIRHKYLDYMKKEVDKEGVKQLFSKAGEVLAIIHNDLQLNCNENWQPSNTFIWAMEKLGVESELLFKKELPFAYMHCDYGFSNIHYIEKQNTSTELVVLDSSPNKFVTFRTDVVGPVYIDIGNMLSCIEGLVPISNYPFMKWKLLPEIKKYFLDGYRAVFKSPISNEWAEKFSYATAQCYLVKKYPWKIAQSLALKLLYNRYKGNIQA